MNSVYVIRINTNLKNNVKTKLWNIIIHFYIGDIGNSFIK